MKGSLSILGILVAFMGCGGGGSSGNDMSQGTSGAGNGCDITMSGVHSCIDYAVGYPNEAAVCAGNHGVAVAACDRTGSTGGCKYTLAIGTETTWFYGATTTAQVMSICSGGGGAFVTP